MNRDEYNTQRRRDDDEDTRQTTDMMRDRLNRMQYRNQRDVDPEQLAAISNVKYEPRKKTTDYKVDENEIPVTPSVDAKGRTAQEWVKLVTAKYPTAKILQSKMPNGPWLAKLPNGKQLHWEPALQGELEEDLSRRGFLRGLGAAALGSTALSAAGKAQANQDQNLGNGFVLTTVDALGGKFKAVLDTQSDTYYMLNRHEGGNAIVRSMAPFITIKNGQINTSMNLGPAVQAALKKAGLLKGVEESVAKGKIDFAKKLQGKVDKHNKAVVKTKQAVGSRVVDIGAGGKEHNEKTDAAWDAAKKKVNEGLKK
jgi:hypothetical protein